MTPPGSYQKYWSGLPWPPPGDLPNPGIKPGLPHCRRILYQLSYQGSPYMGSDENKELLGTFNVLLPSTATIIITAKAQILSFVSL